MNISVTTICSITKRPEIKSFYNVCKTFILTAVRNSYCVITVIMVPITIFVICSQKKNDDSAIISKSDMIYI